MRVLPAIDLYQGRVVRMEKGRKERCHIYDFDPVELTMRFVEEGFKLVHLIDLSAAMDGSDENKEILKRLSAKGLANHVQIGGGIRTIERALELLKMGFRRQLLSSALIERPHFLNKLLDRGIDVVFSLDTSSSGVCLAGWSVARDIEVIELLKLLRSLGLREIVHTDVEADGSLQGRNLKLSRAIAVETGLNILVAGGIASAHDLELVRQLNCEVPNVVGVVVGRAFYEGMISIKEMKDYAG